MLQELVKNYQLEKEKLKDSSFKNEKLTQLIIALKEEKYFKTLDVQELLAFLQEAKYEKYSKEQIETTVNYMMRNDLFSNPDYKEFKMSLLASLETLKSKYISIKDINSLLVRLEKLDKSINDKHTFITDLSLIEEILREKDLDISTICDIALEIDKHNKEAIVKVKEENFENISNLLIKYDYETKLSEYEYILLNNIDIYELEKKLKYLSSIKEYDFLKRADRNKNLTLMLIAPLSNIEKVFKIANSVKLDLDVILPMFYLNEGFTIPKNYLKDDFYERITGCFETFTKNVKLLVDLGYNIPDLYENWEELFYTPTEVLITNLQTFTKYNINITIPNALSVIDENIDRKIDRFIEAGLYSYLKQFPQAILNKDKSLFHRIYYAKHNNLQIKKGYLVKEITSINGYIINEENYKDLVPTYKSPRFETEFYKKLEITKPGIIDNRVIINLLKALDSNYLQEENVYNIANILISRNKVIRLFQSFLNNNIENINYLEGLLFAITNDTLLSKFEFDILVLNVLDKYINNNEITDIEAINLARNLEVDTTMIDNQFKRGDK